MLQPKDSQNPILELLEGNKSLQPVILQYLSVSRERLLSGLTKSYNCENFSSTDIEKILYNQFISKFIQTFSDYEEELFEILNTHGGFPVLKLINDDALFPSSPYNEGWGLQGVSCWSQCAYSGEMYIYYEGDNVNFSFGEKATTTHKENFSRILETLLNNQELLCLSMVPYVRDENTVQSLLREIEEYYFLHKIYKDSKNGNLKTNYNFPSKHKDCSESNTPECLADLAKKEPALIGKIMAFYYSQRAQDASHPNFDIFKGKNLWQNPDCNGFKGIQIKEREDLEVNNIMERTYHDMFKKTLTEENEGEPLRIKALTNRINKTRNSISRVLENILEIPEGNTLFGMFKSQIISFDSPIINGNGKLEKKLEVAEISQKVLFEIQKLRKNIKDALSDEETTNENLNILLKDDVAAIIKDMLNVPTLKSLLLNHINQI